MRDASKLMLVLAVAAGVSACNKPAAQNNVMAENNSSVPADIEALPPDESSATPTDELQNGDDNSDVNEINSNSY